MSTTLANSPRAAPPSERFAHALPRAPRGIYSLDLDAAPPSADLLPRLSENERQRAGRLADPLLRDRFAARRWGLRLALAAHTGLEPAAVPLAWDKRARPVLTGSDLRISATSAAGLALVAIAPHPIGIDILGAASADAAREVCRDLPLRTDAAHAAAHAPGRLALRLWTQLEATLKAAGADFRTPGIATRVRADEWAPAAPCTLRIDHPDHRSARWLVEPLPVTEDFIASLARPAEAQP